MPKQKKSKKIDVNADQGFSDNPFAAAFGLEAPKPQPQTSDATHQNVELVWEKIPKISLRIERKGRGGKTVTLIQGLTEQHLKAAASLLKKKLGVGVGIEDLLLVAQGDQRERLTNILTQLGVKKVTQ